MPKTWTNELKTNRGTATVKVFWNKKVGNYMMVLRSTALNAPIFKSIRFADHESLFESAKAEARNAFADLVEAI